MYPGFWQENSRGDSHTSVNSYMLCSYSNCVLCWISLKLGLHVGGEAAENTVVDQWDEGGIGVMTIEILKLILHIQNSRGEIKI